MTFGRVKTKPTYEYEKPINYFHVHKSILDNFDFLTIIIALPREVVIDTLRNDASAGIFFVQTREECQEKGLEKLKNGIEKPSPAQHCCEYLCECVNH